jgi:hypothetical protein
MQESIAVADDKNVGFAHWKAHLTEKLDEGGGEAYTVEATDVAVFTEEGKIQVVYQLRSPVNFEKREVIIQEPAAVE